MSLQVQYGGVATSELAAAGTHRLGVELQKLKKSILEGSVELATLGVLGSVAMLVVSILGFVGDFLSLSPVRAMVMIYCFIGALIMLILEGIHHAGVVGGGFGTRITFVRIYIHQELHVLTTVTGRAIAYAFFGSLMLANSKLLGLGAAVGAYLIFIGGAMIFVGVRASTKLSELGDGLSESELIAKFDAHDVDSDGKLARNELMELCADLGTTLSARELESALLLLDADKSGFVDKAEFIAWWSGQSWQRQLLTGPSRPVTAGDGVQLP